MATVSDSEGACSDYEIISSSSNRTVQEESSGKPIFPVKPQKYRWNSKIAKITISANHAQLKPALIPIVTIKETRKKKNEYV